MANRLTIKFDGAEHVPVIGHSHGRLLEHLYAAK
jgi:hypothetical protein